MPPPYVWSALSDTISHLITQARRLPRRKIQPHKPINSAHNKSLVSASTHLRYGSGPNPTFINLRHSRRTPVKLRARFSFSSCSKCSSAAVAR